MLLLKCPKCGNKMKCNPKAGELKDKSKRCVYCGRSFKLIGNIAKQF
jgi:uncharacterized Zn-finger protein